MILSIYTIFVLLWIYTMCHEKELWFQTTDYSIASDQLEWNEIKADGRPQIGWIFIYFLFVFFVRMMRNRWLMCFVAFNSQRQRPLLVLHTLKTTLAVALYSWDEGRVITENIKERNWSSYYGIFPVAVCVCVCVVNAQSLRNLSLDWQSFANRYYMRMKHVARPGPIKTLSPFSKHHNGALLFVPLHRLLFFRLFGIRTTHIERERGRDLWSYS